MRVTAGRTDGRTAAHARVRVSRQMIVVAVMFLVNRWKALPPVYGVFGLSFLFAIAAVVMGVFGQVYSAADEPDSLLFLVVFILGPTLPALPFWVCSCMLLMAAMAIVIVDFTNQVNSDEHHLCVRRGSAG